VPFYKSLCRPIFSPLGWGCLFASSPVLFGPVVHCALCTINSLFLCANLTFLRTDSPPPKGRRRRANRHRAAPAHQFHSRSPLCILRAFGMRGQFFPRPLEQATSNKLAQMAAQCPMPNASGLHAPIARLKRTRCPTNGELFAPVHSLCRVNKLHSFASTHSHHMPVSVPFFPS